MGPQRTHRFLLSSTPVQHGKPQLVEGLYDLDPTVGWHWAQLLSLTECKKACEVGVSAGGGVVKWAWGSSCFLVVHIRIHQVPLDFILRFSCKKVCVVLGHYVLWKEFANNSHSAWLRPGPHLLGMSLHLMGWSCASTQLCGEWWPWCHFHQRRWSLEDSHTSITSFVDWNWFTCSSHLLVSKLPFRILHQKKDFLKNLFLLEVGSSRWCYVHQQCPDVMKVNVYQILDPRRFITDQPWTFVASLCKKNQVHEKGLHSRPVLEWFVDLDR